MEDGFITVKDGVNWLRHAETGSGTLFAEGLAGTHAILRPNHLTAWRCRKCEIVTFQYGHRHETDQRRRAAENADLEPLPVDEDTDEQAAEGTEADSSERLRRF